MMAHDFIGDPDALMNYALGEGRELAEVIPIFNKNAPPHVDGVASLEAGDWAWFFAMRVGLAGINEVDYGLSIEDTRLIAGAMGIISILGQIYPEFDPIAHAAAVGKKNEANYPDRALRAGLALKPIQMSRIFESEKIPQLKGFRSKLEDRKIPPIIYQSIQKGDRKMPEYIGAKHGAKTLYKAVVDGALVGSLGYAY